MSTTIDQRVVKMEFDNKQFESGVKTSINSIDRLHKSLDFKSTSNNIGRLADSVDKIGKRFSALGVAGTTAIATITSKAVNAGSRILKALTIEPIISGFQEYETQINATQTILSNTSKEGATIKEVNAALDELNKYADLTIYNFTEMTKNIGTFTAAGVKLQDSVNAIQGIANLAAVSGSTSQQASTAMYQLSQALASGTVKLQDWNSVVNAGMGGQKFQDALTMTAKVHGINVDKMIEKYGSFRETLSQGEWLTAEILTETLQHFTAFTDEYNEETLRAQGYTEKQIAEIKQMGIDATDAATKVKTFTQLWDVTKEATQSGWSQTWRLIIGDFEQAKLTMTEFSDELTAVINSISDRRNALISSGLTSGLNQFASEASVDLETYSDKLYDTAKAHGVAIDQMIKEDGSFEATLTRGWVTADMVSESVHETANSISNMSEEELKAAGYTKEQVEALQAFDQEVQNGTVDLDKWVETLGRASGRENLMESLLNIFKAVMAIAKPVREAFENIFPPMTGDQLYSITEKIRAFTESLIISENTADKIRGTIEGFLTVIKPVFTLVKNGFKLTGAFISNVFPPILNGLITVSGYIGTLQSKMGKLLDVNKLMDVQANLIAKAMEKASEWIHIISDAIGVLIKKITGVDVGNFKEVEAVLDKLFKKLEKVKKSAIETFEAMADGNGKTGDTAKTLKKNLGNAVDSITKKTKGFTEGLSTAINAVVNFAKKVKKFFEPLTTMFKEVFGDFTLGDALNTALLGGIFVTFKKVKQDLGSVKETIIDVLDSARSALETYQNSLKAKTLVSIATAVALLAASLLILSQIDPANLGTSLIAMSVVLVEVMGSLKLLTSGKFAIGPKEAKQVMTATSAMVLMSAAFLILAKALAELSVFQTWDSTWPALVSLVTIMASLTGAAILLGKVGGDKNLLKSAASMAIFALAISSLAKSITKFAEMDVDKTKKGLTILAAILAEIGLFMVLVDTSKMTNARSTILAIASSMIIMAAAISIFGSMDPKVLTQGMVVLASIMTGFTIMLKAISQTNIAGAAATVLALAVALNLLMVPIVIFGHMDLLTLAKGLGTMAIAFISMAAAIAIMKMASGGLGGAAGTLLAMAAALLALTVPIMLIGSMSLGSVAIGIAGLCGTLIALAATAQLISGASLALSSLAKSMLLLGVGALGLSLAITGITLALVTLATMGTAGVTALLASLAAFIAGFIAMAPLIEQGLVVLINTLLNVIQRTGPKLIETVISLIDALLESIANHAESIVRSLLKIIAAIFKALVNLIIEYGPVLLEKGKELAKKLLKGLGDKLGDIKDTAKAAIKKFIKGIKDKLSNIKDTAHEVIQGFKDGISEKIESIVNKAKELGGKFLGGLKNVLGIKSPSREAKKIAEFVVAGFNLGIDSKIKEVAIKANRFAKFWNDALAKGLGAEAAEKVKSILDKYIKAFNEARINSIKNKLAELFDTLTYGKEATSLFIKEFGDISTVENATKSFETANKAVTEYAKKLYLASDAYETNTQKVKDLKSEQKSLEKQIDKLSKKTDDTSKQNLKTAKENLKTTKKELKAAQKEITEGTKQFVANLKTAYEDMQGSISNSLKTSLDPLSVSLETQIDLLKKLEESTDEVTSTTILENMKSQVEGIISWNQRLEALADKGFAAGLLEDLRALGPTATNYIKAFESMTEAEMNQANTYFQKSSNLTVSTFLQNWVDSQNAVTNWSDNLVELAKRGVNQGFLEAVAQAGMSTESLVTALMSATDEQLAELNAHYDSYLNNPNSAAQKAMMAVAASGAGIGTELANAIKAQVAPETEAGMAITETAKATGEQTATAAATGIVESATSTVNTTNVKKAGETLGTAAYNGVKSKINTSTGKTLGLQLCNGLVLGLSSGSSRVTAAARSVAAAALAAAEAELGVESPSKEFMKVGYFADLGFAKGLKKYADKVKDRAEEVGQASLNGIRNALSTIASVVNSDMDASPTIRPVIDLDGLRNDIDSMNGMMANHVIDVDSIRARTMGISAGITGKNTTSTTSADKLQNGNTFTFTQNNYSPKALSQIEIYRQTKNQFSAMKGALQGV